MEITARTAKGFFCSEFPQRQVVTIGNNRESDISIPEYGGLGTCDQRTARFWTKTTRYDRLVAPYIADDSAWSFLFCQVLHCDGLLFVRSRGRAYTIFQDRPIFGTVLLERGETLHVHGVELSIEWDAPAKTIQEIAQDPELPLSTLCWLAEAFPEFAAQNPIIPLLLLENPQVLQRFPKPLQRALHSVDLYP